MKPAKEEMDDKRCSRCVLPSSLAGSNFNQAGECYWCQSDFPNYVPKGEEKLHAIIEQNRSKTDSADCLVGISGGKDSSFVLLEMKQKYGLKVEAFTYVHDGLANFALENARKVAKALDVKHHIVMLPANKHLKSFKAYFEAWVSSEEPVAAAMTCVACKHLHTLGTKLAADRNIPLIIWAESPLETPPFLPTQSESEKQVHSKGFVSLSTLLAKNMIRHKSFRRAFWGDISTSVVGCLSFRPESKTIKLRYPNVEPIQYFDYYGWDGAGIIDKLKEHTGWSVPGSVVSDWHSDCRFNVFKEYMFQKMLGASYTDAFLSNQVRYGLLTRSQAWDKLVKSKAYYASELLRALTELDMQHLLPKCDTSCFDI